MVEWTLDSYEEWVLYVFDRPVPEHGEQEWYWDWKATWWNEIEHPHQVVEYMTRAFENIAELATHFTDAQMNQALWYLNSNACSNHTFALMNAQVPWLERRRCIRSFYIVYEQLYLPKCGGNLGHTDYSQYFPDTPRVEANPLILSCYMWWDINPLHSKPEDPYGDQIKEEMLRVMEKTLDLDSDACREGALHGLGHLHYKHPQRIEEIIDSFLARYPNLSPGIVSYAQAARTGGVM